MMRPLWHTLQNVFSDATFGNGERARGGPSTLQHHACLGGAILVVRCGEAKTRQDPKQCRLRMSNARRLNVLRVTPRGTPPQRHLSRRSKDLITPRKCRHAKSSNVRQIGSAESVAVRIDPVVAVVRCAELRRTTATSASTESARQKLMPGAPLRALRAVSSP